MDAIRHTCGAECIARWVIADDGDDVLVAWCPSCDTAPVPDELSRPIAPEDVSPYMIAQAAAILHGRKH